MSKISAVILNWKRPENVRRILDSLWQHPLIDEVIVWDNNPTVMGVAGKTKLIQSSEDMGLFTRFAAMALAKNRCVLIQDDDLLLPDETLFALHKQWQEAPLIIHGIFGRRPVGGAYSYKQAPYGEVEIVLTRVLLAHRDLAAKLFWYLSRFRSMFDRTVPHGNGEDIFLSYVAMVESGQLNRTHRLPIKELPSPEPICKRAGHVQHRTKLVRAMHRWLEEARKR